jgi:2-polyprenyl-3-methyl-5-hydroxy-6-metoxy-1,4-benzoquinol methylase
VLTREDFYQRGVPANPGQHYRAFVRFASKHAGPSILDLGCGAGAYGGALIKQGLSCIGSDVNIDYLRRALANGMPVVAIDSVLPFADRSFDTVLLLEVIEHVPNASILLSEAFRVARKNVLLTVPNSEDIEVMKANDVTYAHMLSSDHVNFFTLESLKDLLRPYSSDVEIQRSDPIYPYWFLGRSIPFYALRLAFRMHLLKPRFFSRLYAVASVR